MRSPHGLGKGTSSPGQLSEDSGCSSRPRGALLGSSCHDTHGTSLVLPCHLLATIPSAVRAHEATNQLFSSSFLSLSCLLYPEDIGRLIPAMLPSFFFYVNLRLYISFSISCNVDSSFCSLPSLGPSLLFQPSAAGA